MAHVARANPVWKTPPSTIPALACFQGANNYISPSWYPSKFKEGKIEYGKVVPTWNYITVAAHGRPTFIEDKSWLLKLVTRLTQKHESQMQSPWQVTDAPADYIDSLLGAIVGVEIEITKIEGKWKMSQNRSEEDRSAVFEAVRANSPQILK